MTLVAKTRALSWATKVSECVGSPIEVRPFRDAFLYTLVIACLLMRPQGLFVPRSSKPRI